MLTVLITILFIFLSSCITEPVAEGTIEGLLSQMTLEEKIRIIAGRGMETCPVARLGIPSLKMCDGPAGVRFGSGTCFPSPVAMAASWDKELLREIGRALARETRANGRHMLLGPCINIHRVPLGGRNFESFGEDPYLAGGMAVSYINGVQNERIIATPKHFVCNNQEWERYSINTIVKERALREIYLPAFESSIREAGARAVMAAYNKVNGFHCTENNYLLNEILKNEWNFAGFVVSDWGAVHSTIDAANNGLDLEMPDQNYFNKKLIKAVQNGQVHMSMIDDKVRRILGAMSWAGLLDDKPPENAGAIDTQEHHALALQAAREGIVLLKNENNLLPLDAGRLNSIAVIGPNAPIARTGGGGSSEVSPSYSISPLEGITARCGDSVPVFFKEGCKLESEIEPVPSDALSCGEPGFKTKGLQGEYFNNVDLSGTPVKKRIDKVINFNWQEGAPAHGIGADNFSVRWTGRIESGTGGKTELFVTSDDGVRLWFAGKLLMDDWNDHATRTKKVTVMMDPGKAYDLRIEYYERGGLAVVKLGWSKSEKLLADAVSAAQTSDVVVLFAGLSRDYESEGFDRPDMALPDNQNTLIESVCAVNKKVIVVLNTGAPVTMNSWISKVPALLQAWYPGQECGTAIAGVLFGDYNPGGKLPVTFPVSWTSSPAYPYYPGNDGQVKYQEGIFIGYRYFDSNKEEVLFPFGYGLSYTTFDYKNIQVNPETVKGNDFSVNVQLEVQNTGTREGAEIVQLYIHDREAGVERPFKELKGFERIHLLPGESKTVFFTLDWKAFSFYDVKLNNWKVEPGIFDILVGSSSRDIRLTGSIRYE
jgi:beta-glucosidase